MRRKLQTKAGRLLSFLLLPVSLIPILVVVPQIVASHENFERNHQSGPLPAPRVELDRRYEKVPAYSGHVPVLAYHGINAKDDHWSVSRRTFAEHMALLDQLGFETISNQDYARFARGETAHLPERPILVTFDDGRLDSYRGADAVLEKHGMRATMFAIVGETQRNNPFYLRWKELKAMDESGRWDVDFHAGEGHQRIAYDPAGHTAPFYAVRRYTRSGGQETFPDFEARVTRDLFDGRDLMLEHGFEPTLFAVPYSDYGQVDGNDPRIAPLMLDLLTRQFAAVFVQDGDNDPRYTRPGDKPAVRWEAHTDGDVDVLHAWLRRRSPAAIERRERAERRERKAAKQPKRKR